jgi:hypothetical protein
MDHSQIIVLAVKILIIDTLIIMIELAYAKLDFTMILFLKLVKLVIIHVINVQGIAAASVLSATP